MKTPLKQSLDLNDKDIKLKKKIDESYLKGVLIGLKICKEMWAQGTISHENIYENEIYYQELLKNLK